MVELGLLCLHGQMVLSFVRLSSVWQVLAVIPLEVAGSKLVLFLLALFQILKQVEDFSARLSFLGLTPSWSYWVLLSPAKHATKAVFPLSFQLSGPNPPALLACCHTFDIHLLRSLTRLHLCCCLFSLAWQRLRGLSLHLLWHCSLHSSSAKRTLTAREDLSFPA